MQECDKQNDEEAEGLIISPDRLLKIDPKMSQGRLTISGTRIGERAEEASAPGATETTEEN